MKTLAKNRYVFWFALLPMLILMAGCGGGGGGGGSAASTNPGNTTPPADTTAPTVIYTSPAQNAANVAPNGAIAVTFSEKVDPATIAASFSVVDPSGKAAAGTLSYDSSSTVVIFTPAAPGLLNGISYTATVTTAIKDVAGNALAANYSWHFTTDASVDTTPPQVISTFPANGLGVATNSALMAVFSEEMNPSTVTFTLKQGGSSVAGSATCSGATVVFIPSAALAPNTVYTAAITGKDLAGNDLAPNPFTWSFTTGPGPDTVRPTVVATSPANGAQGVSVNTSISVTFSEPMYPFGIFGAIDGVPGTVSFDVSTPTIILKPGNPLKANTTYTFRIMALDLAGNLMATEYVWSFTTQP